VYSPLDNATSGSRRRRSHRGQNSSRPVRLSY